MKRSMGLVFFLLVGIPLSLQASWEKLDLPTDHGFTAIWALDEQIIFAEGDEGLWKTFNGGSNWSMDSLHHLYCIYFVNDTLGFQGGAIITTDGGKTWKKGDTVNGRISPLSFPKNQSLIGYGLGLYDVRKTADGGWHWQILPPLPDVYPGYEEEISPIRGICFPDVDTGYFTAWCIRWESGEPVEDHYTYFKTTDGGETWVLNEEGLWNDDFIPYLVDFPENATVGYMAGGDGKVFKTTNGGATWDTVLKDRPYIVSMCFPENDQVGYVFGDSVANKTTDGGKTWQTAYLTHDSTFYECHFINNRVGFVTGHKNMALLSMPYDPGFVLKTTDGLLGIAEDDWVELKLQLIELSAPAFFSNELKVSYTSRSPGCLKTGVYDASGRQVYALDWQTVSGQGTISLQGANLSSGVYFARVEFSSAEGSETKTLRTVKVR